MMTTITLGLKAISFLLLLLPLVDLVDQHKNGEWVVGERHKPGVYMGQAVGNQTLSTAVGVVHGAIPGNWNGLSTTLSDRPTASTGYLQPSPSAYALASFTSGERRYSSLASFYTNSGMSSSGGFTTKHHHGHGLIATSATATTVTPPQTWPSHSHRNGRGGGGIGGRGSKRSFSSGEQALSIMHKPPSQPPSEQIISVVVDPPMSLASSTRVTGPYFESNKTTIHITARAGQTVMLDCAVVLLQGRTVSWLRRKKDSFQLLTVGNATYNGDSRLGLRFRYPNNWRLGIESVNKGDEGEYQIICQLSTHPPKALIYHVKVIAPAVVILDENGHTVTERHYKVDSSLHLTCRASHVDKLVENVVWLKGDRVLPAGDSRIKVKLTKNQTSGEATAYLSVLSVRKGDSGNYSCRASQATSTIAVHVLNGELPAAVQHESSANRLAVAPSQLATTVMMLMSAAASSSLINVVIFPTSCHNGHPSLVPIIVLSLTLFALARLLIISGAKLELKMLL